MQRSQSLQNPDDRRIDFIKQKTPMIKAQLEEMGALVNRVQPMIDGLHAADSQGKFAKKFTIEIKTLELIYKNFIRLFDGLYEIIHNIISTIHRPNTSVLTHLITQLLAKKLPEDKEELAKAYNTIFSELAMLFKKLHELHQVCIGHMRQLGIVGEENGLTEEKETVKSTDNDATEEENVLNTSIATILGDEIWLHILNFLDQDSVNHLGLTNRRFLNITRDNYRYRLFPVTNFSKVISEKHHIINTVDPKRVLSALSENGQWLAIARPEDKPVIEIFNLDGDIIKTISLSHDCQYLHFTHDNSRLVICNKTCEIYTTKNWEKTNEFELKELATNVVCVNNTYLFVLHKVDSNVRNMSLYCYDLSNGKSQLIGNLGNLGFLNQNKLFASTDQRKVVGMIGDARNNTLYVVNIVNNNTENTMTLKRHSLIRGTWPPHLLHLQLMPNSNKILYSAASYTTSISQYDLKLHAIRDFLATTCSTTKLFKISKNGRYLIAAVPRPYDTTKEESYNNTFNTIELYHLSSGKLLRRITCPYNINITDVHITSRKVIVLQRQYVSIYTFDGISFKPDFNKLREEQEKIAREEIELEEKENLLDTPLTTQPKETKEVAEIKEGVEENNIRQHKSTRTCIMS